VAAALLWACSPFVIWYAQEVRMYALLTAVGLASLLCLERALDEGSRRWLLASASLNLMGFYTHYFYLFVLLCQYLYLGLNLRRHHRAFRWWFLLNGIAVLLYLPWIVSVLLSDFYRAQIAWVAPLSFQTIWSTFWDLTTGKGQPFSILTALSPVLLVSGIVVAGITRQKRRDSPVPGLMWTSLLLPTLLVLLISLQQSLLHSRFLQIILPALILLAVSGLFSLARPRWGWILVALVILAWIPGMVTMYESPARLNRDWRTAMQELTMRAKIGDMVAFRGGQGYHPYWYYYRGPTMERISLTPEDGIGILKKKAASAQRVWLILWDPDMTCQVPERLVPEPGTSLTMTDAMCFSKVLTVLYIQQAP
jgi:hypothetical protein